VIPGKLRDGVEIELFATGSPLSWTKPPLISASYKNDRSRSYLMNLLSGHDRDIRLNHSAKYLCRQSNESHPPEKHLLFLEIIFMLKPTLLEGPPLPP
jgi:hypothetical protein